MNNFIRFIISKGFLKNIAYTAGGIIILLILIVIWLRIYTHHNRSYAVPDFSDLSLEQASEIIEEKKLRFEVFDSVYIPEKQPGIIIDQHPKPDFLVKKNRKIFFTTNAIGPEFIQMPNLEGLTLREGKARLISNGLKMGKLSYRYHLSTNVILAQNLNGKSLTPGDSVAKGSEIDLVISKGLGNDRSMVPDLVGLTIEQARERLEYVLLGLGAAVPDAGVDQNDTLPVFIFRQKPISNPDVLVSLGSTVTVWTTTDSTKLPGYEQEIEADPVLWDELNDNEEDTLNNSIN